MRRQRHHGAVSVSIYALVSSLLLPSCLATPGTPVIPAPYRIRPLRARADAEHVVLADCRDGNGVVSSQMAYYPGSPDSTPQDVAVVTTKDGQARIWAGQKTSGLFTDTGVTFTSDLGPQVDEGEFAGTGNNGYVDFTCWRRDSTSLYEYDGTTCSQVYDCDHEEKPTSTPTPSPTKAASHKGMPTGTEAGIIAGVVSAVGIIAIAGIYWCIQRRLAKKRQASGHGASSSWDCFGLFDTKGKGKQPMQPQPYGPFSPNDPTKKDGPVMPPPAVYELDSNWRGMELSGGPRPPGELALTGPTPELDTKDRQYMQYMRAPRDPMTQ